jgi:DNA-binding PadR family transcriptional regulator
MHSHSDEGEDFGRRGCHSREHAGFGKRGFYFERGGFERGGFGGGRERLFDAGDLQLIILHLLAQKPSYGYELIKAIEERMAGGYAPSPGVVYPTLTLLEERGFTRIESSEGNRKVYGVTAEGRAELAANAGRLKEIAERLEHSGRGFRRGRAPEIMGAFLELRGAVRNRLSRGELTAEQVTKIAEAIRNAAKAIDAV